MAPGKTAAGAARPGPAAALLATKQTSYAPRKLESRVVLGRAGKYIFSMFPHKTQFPFIRTPVALGLADDASAVVRCFKCSTKTRVSRSCQPLPFEDAVVSAGSGPVISASSCCTLSRWARVAAPADVRAAAAVLQWCFPRVPKDSRAELRCL